MRRPHLQKSGNFNLKITLYAAIRLSEADSIGVPLFLSGNALLIPEMDADFNIGGFVDFENEFGYELSFDIPSQYIQREFSVGDPAPILFWVKGAPCIIEGDAESNKVIEMFGVEARTHPVLRDLAGMLNDARTGKFKAQQAEWLAEEISAAYDDVFLEAPSRTRYWIQRYRSALENARKITQPPHPIDVRLRRASSEWLQRFALKAELPMLGSLLGEAAQGIYSVTQIADVTFAYLSHRVVSAKGGDLAKFAADPTIRTLFPHGLYYRYVENGWPHVAFEYDKPDFLQLMNESLLKGRESRAWKPAKHLSQLLFGDRDVPARVDEYASEYVKELAQQYKALRQQAEGDVQFGYLLQIEGEELMQVARRIVDVTRQVSDLCCIIIGADRAQGEMMSGRYQVELHVAERYREILEGYG